jgi:predicted acylesterase/phospholipase RssA
MGILDRELDIYALKRHFEQANRTLDMGRQSADLSFLRAARRALFPLPVVDREPEVPADVLPPRRPRPIAGLEGKRIAVVAGGGAGACVSLIGVVRAFEDAGINPDLIVSCSGGTIWGSMWAAGMSSDEMAEFSLSWHPEDYLDMQWLRFPRFLASGFKGFSGAMKGAAIERLFSERLGELTAGELAIPLMPIVYDMDRGIVDYFGTESTPEVTVGRLVRIAIALPLMIEAVEVGGHLYVDGGIIDLFPLQPIIDDGDFDQVFGINFMLPPQLEPADITGWNEDAFGILEASRQLEQGYHLEFARRGRAILDGSLTIIDAADHRLCRGVPFYEIFIDRSHWPRLIRDGYRRTVAALEPLRLAAENGGYAIAGASGSRSSAASMSASENSGSSSVPAR